MRTRQIAAWIAGVVFCCAAPLGLCQAVSQTLSQSLADNTALSDGTQNGAVQPAGVQANVNAFIPSTVNADVRADANVGWNGEWADSDKHGTSGKFRIGGPYVPKSVGEAVKGRVELATDNGLISDSIEPDKKSKNQLHVTGMRPARAAARQGKSPTMQKGSGNNLSDKESRAKHPVSIVEASAFYSADFPDSTRGTALVSPNDLGATSPLAWQPDMTHSFPDFTMRQFLRPSLHVARTLGRQSEKAAPNKGSSTKDFLRYDFNLPSLSTSMGDSLQTHPGGSYDPFLDRE